MAPGSNLNAQGPGPDGRAIVLGDSGGLTYSLLSLELWDREIPAGFLPVEMAESPRYVFRFKLNIRHSSGQTESGLPLSYLTVTGNYGFITHGADGPAVFTGEIGSRWNGTEYAEVLSEPTADGPLQRFLGAERLIEMLCDLTAFSDRNQEEQL
ncbi:MAG: hypothetical protein LUF87_08295 [Alistipes sp.]|nr:hypothetical protein [Alistipes sp.]